MMNKKFWKWKNLAPEAETEPADAERVLEIYGTIAEESWFEDDVTPQMFRDELFAGNGPVTIWMNSPGGDCIAASQIYTMLMDYPGDVTIIIDGIAASAASVIAMAGTRVRMAATALMMIHNPMTVAFGDQGEMQKASERLAEVKESIINAYEIRTGMSRAKISHMMDAETWMNAHKAIEMGFADDIFEDEKRTIDAPAFAFAARTAEKALLNKLVKPADGSGEASVTATVANTGGDDAKPEATNEAAKEVPEAVETKPEVTGTPMNDLVKRLSLIK